jgi:hypothetical protein
MSTGLMGGKPEKGGTAEGPGKSHGEAHPRIPSCCLKGSRALARRIAALPLSAAETPRPCRQGSSSPGKSCPICGATQIILDPQGRVQKPSASS